MVIYGQAMKSALGKWSPADASRNLNAMAADTKLDLSLTLHARERMAERGLIMGDVLHVLKNGFVFEEPEGTTRPDLWKYKIEGLSPNSHGRHVRLVVIPGPGPSFKIVTVMWKDER